MSNKLDTYNNIELQIMEDIIINILLCVFQINWITTVVTSHDELFVRHSSTATGNEEHFLQDCLEFLKILKKCFIFSVYIVMWHLTHILCSYISRSYTHIDTIPQVWKLFNIIPIPKPSEQKTSYFLQIYFISH